VAGDLIPPPSPARRPADPEAEPQATAQLEEATQLAAEAEAPPPGPSPHRNRFGFVLGALAGIGACAAVLAVALFAWSGGGDGPELAANWSAWQPSTTRMVDGAVDIAAHVGPLYKLDDGKQLTQVAAYSLAAQDLAVAVRPQEGPQQFLEGEGLFYTLSALRKDEETTARDRLLRREALEIALYSFRYLDDVTMVAVGLPQKPPPGATAGEPEPEPGRVVFFRPGDLLPQLQVPLDATLAPATPTPKALPEAETLRVTRLVRRNEFLATREALEPDQDYLVLAVPETDE